MVDLSPRTPRTPFPTGRRTGAGHRTTKLVAWAMALGLAGAGLVRTAAAEAGSQASGLAAARQAAQAAPTSIEAQVAYGRALVRAGELKQAHKQMERVAKLGKDSPEALFEVARVHFAEDDYRRSRAACRALGKAHPGHVLHDVCMARAFLVWRRASRADEPLQAALEKAPDHIEVQFALAETARYRSDFATSEGAYRQVLSGDPQYVEATLGLAALQRLKGDDNAAFQTLREGSARHPDSPELAFELGKLSPPQQAIPLLKRALKTRPGWIAAEEALGGALLAGGQAAEAEARLRAVLKRAPQDGQAMGRLGQAQLALGQRDKAEATLTRALELQPSHPDAMLSLARIYAASERIEEAFEAYRKAAGMRPSDSTPLREAAQLAHQEKRNVLASAFIDRALERHPRNPRLHALRGDILVARGQKKEASESYRKALALRPLAQRPGQPAPQPIDRADVTRKLEALR